MYVNPFSLGDKRNKPCICESGKKAKKCHGFKERISLKEFNELNELIKIYNAKQAYIQRAPKFEVK